MDSVRLRHIPINVRRTDWRVVALATTALLLGGPLVHADDALPTGTNELRSVAEKGDPVAQLCLGIRYYAGWHKDPTRIAEAEKWFRLSAAQGNAQAEEHLGQLYYLGRDQSPDYPEAVAWFRKAAEHGNREAQLRLAQMYREGKGVAVDRDEAKKWSDLAAQSPPSTPCYPRTEVVERPPGAATAASLPDFPDLRREAEKGNADAQFRLGERYYDERVRDAAKDAEAQKWLRMAAAQGNGQAEDRLGWIYYRGNGVPQDYIEAAQWYRRGAEHGNVDAMTRLGNMYREGQGVSRDPDQARKLINKANDIATRPARQREYEWLAGIMVGMAAFAGALMLLQRKKISGWRRVVLASFIHIVGIALVLNSLITYGLPQLLFPKCSAGAFLSTDCWNYKDLAVRHFATELHDWQMVNLIWRFMVFFGFVFDALAIWYVAYLCLPLFPAWRRRAQRA